MLRLIPATFALSLALGLAASANAMPIAPIQQTDMLVNQVAAGCGVGRTRVRGVCVARTTKRQARRAIRREGREIRRDIRRCVRGTTC